MENAISSDIGNLLRTMDQWLTPLVDSHCTRTEAGKLRVFRANLADIHQRLRVAEGDILSEMSLSMNFGQLADSFAGYAGGVTFEPEAIAAVVGLLSELEAMAWALEVALGIRPAEFSSADLPALALGKMLADKGVVVGTSALQRSAAR